jgi:hypothetical protein
MIFSSASKQTIHFMNTRMFFPVAIALIAFTSSCGNNNTGVSTPIDSTTINGTPSVQYRKDNPADTSQYRAIDSPSNPGLSNSKPDLSDIKDSSAR